MPREKARLNKSRWEYLGKLPFLVFAIGGYGGIWGLKYLGVSQLSVTLIACGCIVGYVVLILSLTKLRLRDDHVGDNAYYLGFIYTLASLSWALTKFTSGGVDLIVESFGIAIFSTVVGIVARVGVNQMRRDPVEIEQEARMELSDAVVRLRTQIDDAVLALSSFARHAQQAAAESIELTHKQATSTMESVVIRVSEASTRTVTHVGETSEKAIARIDEAMLEFSTHSTELNKLSRDVVKTLKSLMTRIEKAEVPTEVILERMKPAMAAAEASAIALRQRLEDERGLRQSMRADAESLRVSLTEGAERWRAIAETAASAASTMASSVGELGETMKQVSESAGRAAADMSQSLEALVAAVRRHNDELAAELEKSREYTKKTHDALVSMAELVTQRLQ